MNIGDLVKSKDLTVEVLACGSGIYDNAVVASLKPFILISQGGDMRWDDVDANNFEVIGHASLRTLINVETRLSEDINTSKEPKVEIGQDLFEVSRTGAYIFFKDVLENEHCVKTDTISLSTQNIKGRDQYVAYLIHYERHTISVNEKTYRQIESFITGGIQ